MPAFALRFSLLVCVALLLLLGMGTSCNSKHKGVHYSQYQVAGTSKLTVFIDSLEADQGTTDNTLYMELMTEKDTFFVKPIGQELSFPKLADSLTQATIYYKDWSCQIRGNTLRDEYRALYFPNQAATIIIDTYPFEHPMAKRWLNQHKERVYYEIRFQKEGRYFLTFMTQDKRRTERQAVR